MIGWWMVTGYRLAFPASRYFFWVYTLFHLNSTDCKIIITHSIFLSIIVVMVSWFHSLDSASNRLAYQAMLRYYQQNPDDVSHPLHCPREHRPFCSLYRSWGPVVMILISKQIETDYWGLIVLSVAIQSHLYKINSYRKVSDGLQTTLGALPLGSKLWGMRLGIWKAFGDRHFALISWQKSNGFSQWPLSRKEKPTYLYGFEII